MWALHRTSLRLRSQGLNTGAYRASWVKLVPTICAEKEAGVDQSRQITYGRLMSINTFHYTSRASPKFSTCRREHSSRAGASIMKDKDDDLEDGLSVLEIHGSNCESEAGLSCEKPHDELELSTDYVKSLKVSSKRTSLVGGSSLLKLCNGCYSRNIVECAKGINAWRSISTAAERSDFQLSGSYQNDDSLACQQNHARFYPEKQNMVDSNKLLNKQKPDYVAQANPSGSYWNNCASAEQISYGAGQIANDVHVNVTQNVHNLVGHNGSVNGYFGQGDMKIQQNVGVGVNNLWGSMMHPNAFVEKHSWTQEPGHRIQSPNVYSSSRPVESQENLRGNLNQNIGRFQQSPNDRLGGSNDMHQQYLGSGQSVQCLKDGQYSPNLNTVHRSMVSSHVSSNANPNYGESAEVSNDSSYRGTLEELDNFCMEGKVKEAVEVLDLLKKLHIPVDLPRYLQLMHQCGETKSLEEAKIVHRHVLQHLSPLQVSTYNKILEMYLECGSVDNAIDLFNSMLERNLTTWDTMITQLAKNGFAEDSIDLFTQFKNLGLKPDGQMFIGVFSACSMLGDIDEGMLHFESMNKDYGIVPSMAHFVSVVDMIGSIGNLDEAFEFIEKMPMEPSADIWERLMNLCRIHGNIELGDRCAELVEQLDPSCLNEQSKAGLVPVKASDLTKEKEKKKLSSKNLLEVRSRVHEYRAGDTSHPENDKIYALLRGLKSQMKEAGYIPETKFVLHDIDQEGKEEALLAHSERLAVAYGLLSSSVRSPIRVIKNLRVCGDCHTALKIISKIVGRELIIRDAKRFHHFKDGLCSCRDYW
ncbi:pentatricopeptide repeat-containing protein At4g32450, mitochondrial-like isoform X1 [Abrus precatorius]|uniref:Pentatricopeptide repeat-containing protein At4g32450, mitochondrial-like isoform X1 n=1 Tax=Abrus precatorius TaxID=3816 RepID=A0A8B8M878_ABRPR|nr:pentatricopeptide repeat-containing protein At4g32450, mitochondrial-like isoform X1 [Abrus precatorius]